MDRCKFYDGYKDKKTGFDYKWELKDIEDLMSNGESDLFCPYYLQMDRARNADIILMPYMYLINP